MVAVVDEITFYHKSYNLSQPVASNSQFSVAVGTREKGFYILPVKVCGNPDELGSYFYQRISIVISITSKITDVQIDPNQVCLELNWIN